MDPCSRCESLPDSLPTHGELYLAPPMAPVRQRITGVLRDLALEFSEPYPGVLQVNLHLGEPASLCGVLGAALNPLEMRDTRSLLTAGDGDLAVHQLTQMRPLASLISQIRDGWLVDLLRDDQLVVHFQPIIPCSDPSRVFAFECLLRGVGPLGDLIQPEEMFRCARASDLLFYLDRVARELAVREAAHQDSGSRVFINFTPTAIYSPTDCLQSTLRKIEEFGLPPEQVVFEVVESERVEDLAHLAGILAYYRDRGFRVAMDDLGAGYSSLNLLNRLHPDFVKIDIELVSNVDQAPYKARITSGLLRLARDLGVRTVAEGVETPGEWRWLAEEGADYLQGFLFARPATPLARPTIPAVPESISSAGSPATP